MGKIVTDVINLSAAPNPEAGYYIVGFDIDGILKKKDSSGVITNIEGGTGGTGSGVSQAYVDNAISDAISTALLINNNLGDLDSISEARTNLDVYSTAEVDNAIASGGSPLELEVTYTGSPYIPIIFTPATNYMVITIPATQSIGLQTYTASTGIGIEYFNYNEDYPVPNNPLTSIEFNNLEFVKTDFNIHSFLIGTVSCPNLVTIGGTLDIYNEYIINGSYLNFPELRTIGGGFSPNNSEGNFYIQTSGDTISFENLTTVMADFQMNGVNVTTLNFPSLTSVGYFYLYGNDLGALSTVDFSSLKTCISINISDLTLEFSFLGSLESVGDFNMNQGTSTVLNLPLLQNANYISTNQSPIVDVDLSSLSYLEGNFTIMGADLSLASVEYILSVLVGCFTNNYTSGLAPWGTGYTFDGVSSFDQWSQELNLSGGTSAGEGSLTAGGLADKATLEGRGATITLNP